MPHPPPELPADLLDRFGAPEDVFGPNRRFRTASAVAGGGLVLLGVAFCAMWVAALVNGGLPPGGALYLYLGGGLVTVGAVAVLLRQVPQTWVFVCPRGLVRARGANWDGVGWDAVVRFEDNTLPTGAATIRQCRVVLSDGSEWGFLADFVADFGRLCRVLRQRVADREVDRGDGVHAPDRRNS